MTPLANDCFLSDVLLSAYLHQLNVNNAYFQTDLVDLKEQLRIHESISKLGVKDDDGVKRNLEADEWRTPG
jgi:hypothetical protein